jgi:hypothetical protein
MKAISRSITLHFDGHADDRSLKEVALALVEDAFDGLSSERRAQIVKAGLRATVELISASLRHFPTMLLCAEASETASASAARLLAETSTPKSDIQLPPRMMARARVWYTVAESDKPVRATVLKEVSDGGYSILVGGRQLVTDAKRLTLAGDDESAALAALASLAVSHALARRRQYELRRTAANHASAVEAVTKASRPTRRVPSSGHPNAIAPASGPKAGGGEAHPTAINGPSSSNRRRLTGSRWNDLELERFVDLLQSGELSELEQLEIRAPNSIGARGIRALTRALLFGCGSQLRSLHMAAGAAEDDELSLLAAALSARQPISKGDQHAPVYVRPFLAAPHLWDLKVSGSARATHRSQRLLRRARAARAALAPPPDSDADTASDTTKVPDGGRRRSERGGEGQTSQWREKHLSRGANSPRHMLPMMLPRERYTVDRGWLVRDGGAISTAKQRPTSSQTRFERD